MEHCATIAASVIRCTVTISLVLSLQRSDGQGACVARRGARESFGDPRGSFITTIDQGFRGRSWELLVPAHTQYPNVAAASRAGDGDPLARGRGHGGRLGQDSLGPASWKGERQR